MSKKKTGIDDALDDMDDPGYAAPADPPTHPAPVAERDETVKTYFAGNKGFMRMGVQYSPGEPVTMPVWEFDCHVAEGCDVAETPPPSPEGDANGDKLGTA